MTIIKPIIKQIFKFNQMNRKLSLRDIAYGRIFKGEGLNSGNIAKEGIIYTPKRPSLALIVSEVPILTRERLLDASRYMIESLSEEELNSLNSLDLNEFYLNDINYQEQAEKDKHKEPEEREVLIVKNCYHEIPLNRFGEDELTLWMFKDQAVSYGELLGKNKFIKQDDKLSVDMLSQGRVDEIKFPFTRPIILNGFNFYSTLDLKYNFTDL